MPAARKNMLNAEQRELLIYDVIGVYYDGVTARDVRNALAELGEGDVTVRINSPGGEVAEAAAIYNALKEHAGTVRVVIDGVAFSSGSWVALAGDEIRIHKNAMMMIHDPSGAAWGTAEDLRREAGVLDKAKDTIVGIYLDRTGRERQEIVDLMTAETYLTADEALALGLVDTVVENGRSASRENLVRLGRLNLGYRLPGEILRRNGAELAAALNDAIDAIAEDEDDERTREDVVAELAEAAGIEAATVRDILAGSIDCPTRERLEAFAGVLQIELDDLIEAAGRDGCDLADDDEEDGDAAGEPDPDDETPPTGNSGCSCKQSTDTPRRNLARRRLALLELEV